ncbi:MAG: hypothetical protein WKG01_27785 [Kofleriaceae bacterium]
MELDDLKATWAAHGATLERDLSLTKQLLHETMTTKARTALRHYLGWRAMELVLGVVAIALVAPILASHVGEPRYLIAGGSVLAYAVAMTAACGVLVMRSLRVDYRGMVTAIQRELEQLTLLEYRVTKWAVLGGVVVWLPAGLIAFEAATGVAALARVDLAWLIGNLAFGTGVLTLGMWWSRRHVERSQSRIVDALAGRSLALAKRELEALARFVRD